MYKTFESRTPFSYGVQAFDQLIQTEQMPHSFVLYQEQEMAALNYAGIPMADCYTAIKNIAKKREEKVLAYKDTFKQGFENVMITEEHKTKGEATALADQLWQIIEDSARYSFNASHSYCVALDSLYEAWLKANHPLEFYETALRIYEKKGDKDKMNDLKEEAEKYFNINFPPFRFGQDNRTISADHATNSITNSLRAIKGYGKTVGELLWQTAREAPQNSFIEVLVWMDQHGLKDAKVRPLVQIDYFQRFGNSAELLRIMDVFNFFNQGTAKSIKKEKLDNLMSQYVSRHATDKGKNGNELKSYTITDMDGLLHELELYILNLHIPEMPYKVRAENQREILGYVDLTTGEPGDRRKLYVLDVYALKSKTTGKPWKYKLKTKSIGSGKVSELDIRPWQYDRQAIVPGDIIWAARVKQDDRGYWDLLDYQMVI